MINVDVKKGELKFNKLCFSAKTKLNYLNRFISSNEVELWNSNSIYKTYRLIKNELILILSFKSNFLNNIEIYPLKKYSISFLIEKIGGEKSYEWGEIKLKKDDKAGYQSILINFF